MRNTQEILEDNISRIERDIMSLNEQLKEVIKKLNTIQGQLLSLGKKVKVLEEKKEKEYEVPLLSIAEAGIIAHLWKHLGPSLPAIDEEEESIEESLDALVEEGMIEEVEPEVIDPELIQALEEVVNGED